MRKIVLWSLSLFALAACNNMQNTSNDAQAQDATEIAAIGGEKDGHGCLVGAGETWSKIKQSCIQVFDVARRLNPVEVADGEAVISAFVLLDDDSAQLELFLPGVEDAAVMDKGEGQTYQKDSLRYDAAAAELYINDAVRYKAE